MPLHCRIRECLLTNSSTNEPQFYMNLAEIIAKNRQKGRISRRVTISRRAQYLENYST